MSDLHGRDNVFHFPLQDSTDPNILQNWETPNESTSIRRLVQGFVVTILVIASFALGLYFHRAAHAASQTTNASGVSASEVPSGRATIAIDVHGDVIKPGVYVLPVNARVRDAVAAAGGYVHPEDARLVNAAAVLDDGAELVIPNAADGSNTVQKSSGRAPAVSETDDSTPQIDINTASEQTLETLPGIGPAKAIEIVQYRTEHGAFHSLADLQHVPGIGAAIASKLEGRLFFSIPH